jgi:hypothetical protein
MKRTPLITIADVGRIVVLLIQIAAFCCIGWFVWCICHW